MKTTILLVLMLSSLNLFAQESPGGAHINRDGSYLCLNSHFMQSNAYGTYNADNLSLSYAQHGDYKLYYAANISCEHIEQLQTLAGATAVGLDIASVYLACTGVGSPIAIKLQVAGAGIHFLDFILGNIPCDDSAEEQKIQNKIQSTVCKSLRANGIDCNESMSVSSQEDSFI